MTKGKKSLGRDPFEDAPDEGKSKSLKQLICGKALKGDSDTKAIEVKVELTPSNIKHLDALRVAAGKRGKGQFTRNELIRIAVTLLSIEDF